MSDWQQQFDTMRKQFLQRAHDRLATTAGMLERLRADGADQIALAHVRKDFHWLSGTGGTYKLPQVSTLGAEGEELCDLLAHTGDSVSSEQQERLAILLSTVRTLLANCEP